MKQKKVKIFWNNFCIIKIIHYICIVDSRSAQNLIFSKFTISFKIWFFHFGYCQGIIFSFCWLFIRKKEIKSIKPWMELTNTTRWWWGETPYYTIFYSLFLASRWTEIGVCQSSTISSFNGMLFIWIIDIKIYI